MKYRVIIADDEPETVVLLGNLIHWDALNMVLLCSAANGNELCEKVNILTPDIVLVDMNMPGIHGAELIGALSQVVPTPKIIVVSGYDDFTYTRAAIYARVIGYILKPVDEAEINIVLQRAIEELNDERMKKNKELQASVATAKIQNYIKDQEFWEALEHNKLTSMFWKKHDREMEQALFQVCFFKFLNFKEVSQQIFTESSSLLMFGIKNIVDELFSNDGVCYYNNRTKDFILLLTGSLSQRILQDKLEKTCSILQNNLMLQTYIGVSEQHEDSNQLRQLYTNALLAVENMNLYRTSHVCFFDDYARQVKEQNMEYRNLLEYSLRKSVFVFSNTVSEIYQNPLQYSIQTISAFTHLWNYIYNLCLSIPIVLENAELRIALENCHQEVRHQFNNSSILVEWLSFSSLLCSTKDEDSQLSRKITRYIDSHYQQKLTVNDLAVRFHLSRQHLFRIFKEETGLSPHNYIMLKKIEKSKKLLCNPEINIAEVVALLAFSDESHFIRTFKKIEGITPSQYKQQIIKENDM